MVLSNVRICLFQRGGRTRHIYSKDEGNKRRWVVQVLVKFHCREGHYLDLGKRKYTNLQPAYPPNTPPPATHTHLERQQPQSLHSQDGILQSSPGEDCPQPIL